MRQVTVGIAVLVAAQTIQGTMMSSIVRVTVVPPIIQNRGIVIAVLAVAGVAARTIAGTIIKIVIAALIVPLIILDLKEALALESKP